MQKEGGSEKRSKEKLYTCVFCSSDLKRDSFYKSRNRLLDAHFSLCKGCACREANDSIEGFHDVLRLLDVPFIPEIYKDCEATDNTFSAYMLRINNPKKYVGGKKISELHYIDSPDANAIMDVDGYIYKTDEELAELKDLFGSWWTREQLIAMNKELDKMFIQYGGDRENLPALELYCELITLKWLSRKNFEEGNIKEGKQLSDARQARLKDNKMNVSALKDKRENDSFGVKIDHVEYEPILPSKKYYDIDGIGFMWERMLGQLLRFVGVNKTPIEKDALEMIEYVEKHPDYSQDME